MLKIINLFQGVDFRLNKVFKKCQKNIICLFYVLGSIY
ncbi:3-methyladenine DNA glycosylase [Borreliella garinii BgVir]|nr:3-methyladenine DNA glycosylase [Borreliella garinii BgVir]